MAAKLARLTHKIAKQLLHLVAESCVIAVIAPGDQSGNFWIHSRTRAERCSLMESTNFPNSFFAILHTLNPTA